jgi:hypothetical protein
MQGASHCDFNYKRVGGPSSRPEPMSALCLLAQFALDVTRRNQRSDFVVVGLGPEKRMSCDMVEILKRLAQWGPTNPCRLGFLSVITVTRGLLLVSRCMILVQSQ